MKEIVKVVIRALKPGALIFPEEVEETLTDFVLSASGGTGRDLAAGDFAEAGFFQLRSSEDAKEVPQDQYVELLKPLTFIHFHCFPGQMEESVSNLGNWEVFSEVAKGLLEYAKKSTQIEFGCKESTQEIYTVWNCWTRRDYWGDHDAGEDFLGILNIDIMNLKQVTP